jgi:MoxR-like ATPase
MGQLIRPAGRRGMDNPAMATSFVRDIAALRGAVERAKTGLTERESLVEVLALAAVAGEHVLVVGPPGTAKSEAVRRVASELGGQYFEYLLGRFTEPNEVFGPIDLNKLRAGVVEVETTGMLPEAEIAFLDEVFLGSTAILNTLLGILNERIFRRGSTVRACPLRLCVGATNALPDDVSLAAFADRFLVRVFVEPVADASLEDLLDAGWVGRGQRTSEPVGVDTIDRLRSAVAGCNVAAVRPILGTAVRRLRSAGIQLSDRRVVRSQALIAAAAVLDGRSEASAADLWTLPLVVPTAEAQHVARATLADVLATAQSIVLPNAAEEYSSGLLARARRLVETGRGQLASSSTATDQDARLRMEATLREIDASFAPAEITGELADVRAALIAAVSP